MKDSEARGLVLRRLYDIRHNVDQARPQDFKDLAAELPDSMIPNMLGQLADQALIEYRPHRSTSTGKVDFFHARIKAPGVDIIEGSQMPPIPIVIPVSINKSVSVHGSQNVQIGGQGNTQTVIMDFEKLNNIVDSSNASITEKDEAKSLLKKLSENKLVRAALSALIGKFGSN